MTLGQRKGRGGVAAGLGLPGRQDTSGQHPWGGGLGCPALCQSWPHTAFLHDPSNPIWGILWSSLYRWGNWGSEKGTEVPWVSQPSSTKARTQTQAVRTCDWMRGSTYSRCPPAHSTSLSYCHSLTMGDRHREVKQLTRGHTACKWQNLGLQPPLHTLASTMGTGQRELARQPPPVPKDSVGKLRQLWVGPGSC